MAIGRFVVRAQMNYSAGPGQFVPNYFGSSPVRVRPKRDWRLTRTVSTSDVRDTFQLRPRRSMINVDSAGNVSWVGSLEGYSDGLIQWSGGSFNLLATAGTPSLVPGSIMFDFNDPAVNSNGQVLTLVSSYGLGGSLMIAGPGERRFLAVDGAADGGVEEIRGINITRYAFNDFGSAVFRATFRYLGTTETLTGLFRVQSTGLLQLEVASDQPLPALNGRPGLDTDFGIDNSDTIYFFASDGVNRALYRKRVSEKPERLLGTGDFYLGQAVRSMGQLAVAPAGHFSFYFNSGPSYLALAKGGDYKALAALPLNSFNNNYGVSATGEAVFHADAGLTRGIYTWDGVGAVKDRFLINHPSPNGELMTQFDSAGIAGDGTVFAQARTVNNLFLVLRSVASKRDVAFQAGVRIVGRANPIYSALALGGRKGPAHVLAGGNRVSVMEVNGSSLVPKAVIGDRLPGGGFFESGYPVRKATNGDIFLITDLSLHRIKPAGTDLLARFPLRTAEGQLNAPSAITGNSAGQVAIYGGSSFGVARMWMLENGLPTKVLANLTTNPTYRTDCPAGGYFESYIDMWMDEAGRVYAYLRYDNGKPGLFLWDNGTWTTLLSLTDTQLLSRKITAINAIRVGGNRYFAYLTVDPGIPVIAEYRAGTWVSILTRGDPDPAGNIVDNVNTFDANTKGELLIRVSAAGTTGLLFVSGTSVRPVVFINEPQENGDFIRNIDQIDLRDDGTIYFTALTYFDELVVYAAQPLF